MKQYHKHLKDILQKGARKEPAREGMPGSISLFGYQNRYDLQEGFPILTTKKVNFKNIIVELLWFLRGDTNIKYLVNNGCNIWNEDAYNYYLKQCKQQGLNRTISFELFCSYIKGSKSLEELTDDSKRNSIVEHTLLPLNYTLGDCGKQYGWLWRNWSKEQWTGHNDGKIDQITDLIEGLKTNPSGRRHIISAWNPATLDDMALNACHAFVQFNCRKISEEVRYKKFVSIHSLQDQNYVYNSIDDVPKYYLDCQLYQRSADMFLGVPYNIASYALLTHIIAKIVGMIPGEFIHTFGDSHIYDNHLEQVNEILSRDVKKYTLPALKIDDDINWEMLTDTWEFKDLTPSDFELINYQSYPTIKAKLSTGLKK